MQSMCYRASHLALVVKNSPANAGDKRDRSTRPGLEGCPGGGHGDSPQYSCLESPMDRGALSHGPSCCRIRHDLSNLPQHSTCATW